MSTRTATALHWVEQGRVPDGVVRLGIQRLLKARLAELRDGDADATAALTEAFVATMATAPIAPLAEMANAQHYELPAEFFAAVLGPHRKYSSGFWPGRETTLEQAEAAALEATCERAAIADGQRILELGCGWGSLTLWMAERYRRSRITAISNSHSQREFIEARAALRGLTNVEVLTRDMNTIDTPGRF
jgi:cyclopropane-fatty-acyl-phospholipid synthase